MKQLINAKKFIVIVITLVLLISIITWVYPYSKISVYKSYTYDKGLVLKDGKTYGEIVQKFKKRLEFDYEEIDHVIQDRLETDYEEIEHIRTVNSTHYILPLFEQDWYTKEDAVTIKKQDLEIMLAHVKNTKSTLLNLMQYEDYSSEATMYLIALIYGLNSMEEDIRLIQHEPFLSRGDISRSFRNLRENQRSLFYTFTVFYDLVLRY